MTSERSEALISATTDIAVLIFLHSGSGLSPPRAISFMVSFCTATIKITAPMKHAPGENCFPLCLQFILNQCLFTCFSGLLLEDRNRNMFGYGRVHKVGDLVVPWLPHPSLFKLERILLLKRIAPFVCFLLTITWGTRVVLLHPDRGLGPLAVALYHYRHRPWRKRQPPGRWIIQ